jgi:hypothetical protein
MDENSFKSEMMRAEQFRTLIEQDRAEYWAGYIRGIRKAYHGENFGTAEEHALWLKAADDEDETRKQRGEGYKAGLAFE